MTENNILDDELTPRSERRRKLLPTWIKVFLWIFMVFGGIAPIALVFGLLGADFSLGSYGLETTAPLSVTGLIIIAFFALKGAVSFGLWMEKDWAISLAIIDAIIGIGTCAIVMLVLPFLPTIDSFNFSLRLELVALIPYLIKMKKIKGDWESRKLV